MERTKQAIVKMQAEELNAEKMRRQQQNSDTKEDLEKLQKEVIAICI